MAISIRVFGLASLATIGSAGLGYWALGQSADPTIDGSVASGPVDVQQILSYLPESVTVTFDDQEYDQASGKTIVKDLKITFGDIMGRGLSIDTLTVAGFDSDFLQARMEGDNFDQSAVLIDHLDARNISLFGMEAFYEQANKAYLDKINEFAGSAHGEETAEIEQSIERIDYVIEKILIDDFELMPFMLIKKDRETDEGMVMLQSFAAYSRAVGAKQMAMTGLSLAMEMTQDGQPMNMQMSIPSAGVTGWRGADYQRSYAEGVTFDMAISVSKTDEMPFELVEMSGGLASYSVENVRLDKALSWLARAEIPPTTETDLMSLGLWEFKDMSFTLFDAPFYAIESSVTDMSNFNWLVPTNITHKTDNLVYNIGALFEIFTELSPDIQDNPDLEMFAKALSVMETYDLSAPSMDLAFAWNWEEGSGPASLFMETGLDGYGTFAFDLGGRLGRFEAWEDVAKEVEAGGDKDLLEALAQESLAFGGARLEMQDRGGNDRLFKLVIALADLFKDENPQWAALAAYDEETLKLLASSSIIGGAGLAAKELPEVRGYAKALADYITEGGTFTIALAPETPISFETLSQFSDIHDPQRAKDLFDAMGFKVTHTGVD